MKKCWSKIKYLALAMLILPVMMFMAACDTADRDKAAVDTYKLSAVNVGALSFDLTDKDALWEMIEESLNAEAEHENEGVVSSISLAGVSVVMAAIDELRFTFTEDSFTVNANVGKIVKAMFGIILEIAPEMNASGEADEVPSGVPSGSSLEDALSSLKVPAIDVAYTFGIDVADDGTVSFLDTEGEKIDFADYSEVFGVDVPGFGIKVTKGTDEISIDVTMSGEGIDSFDIEIVLVKA